MFLLIAESLHQEEKSKSVNHSLFGISSGLKYRGVARIFRGGVPFFGKLKATPTCSGHTHLNYTNVHRILIVSMNANVMMHVIV